MKNEVTVNIPLQQYEDYKNLLEYKKEIESGNTYITQDVSYVSFSHNFEIRDKFISKDEAVKIAVDKTNDIIKLLDAEKEKYQKELLDHINETNKLQSELNKYSKFKSLLENMPIWDFIRIKCKSNDYE